MYYVVLLDADYDIDNFKEVLKKYSINCIDELINNDIDCIPVFCTMTESDFQAIGLNMGQSRKCWLVAQQINKKK